MKLKVDFALLGSELKLEKNVCIELSPRCIEAIEPRCAEAPDLYIASSIAMPPLCNAHTHPMDAALAEYGEDMELSDLVSLPRGLKYRKLVETDTNTLIDAVAVYLRRAAESGVVLLGAVAELGSLGIEIFSKVSSPWIAVDVYPQPHPNRARDLEEYIGLLKRYSRLSIDTLLSLEPIELEQLGHVAEEVNGVIQIHVSETHSLFEKRDYQRLKYLGSRAIVVHGTYLDVDAYRKWIEPYAVPLVLCPRSNVNHVGKLPEVGVFLEHARKGYAIAVGTDNGAWFTPSPLEEIHYAYLAYRKQVPDPEELAKILLYAATIGCFKTLGSPYRGIKVGSPPIILLLVDPFFQFSQSPVIAAVRRGLSAEKVLVVGDEVVPLPSRRLCSSKLLQKVISSIAPSPSLRVQQQQR